MSSFYELGKLVKGFTEEVVSVVNTEKAKAVVETITSKVSIAVKDFKDGYDQSKDDRDPHEKVSN